MFGPAVWWYDGYRMEGRVMGQVLHGSATTTETVRRAIQARQESVRAAAKRYGVSPTTVQKWRSRQTSTDAQMGPKQPRFSVLSLEGGRHRRFPAAHPAAAGRLPLRAPAHPPAPDPLQPAPPPAASRH